MCPQLLADVTPHQQGDEGTDRRAFEPGGHLLQALVNRTGVEVLVELLVDNVRDVVQLGVDFGLSCAPFNRRNVGHASRCHRRVRLRKISSRTCPVVLRQSAALRSARITQCSLVGQRHVTKGLPTVDADAAVMPT